MIHSLFHRYFWSVEEGEGGGGGGTERALRLMLNQLRAKVIAPTVCGGDDNMYCRSAEICLGRAAYGTLTYTGKTYIPTPSNHAPTTGRCFNFLINIVAQWCWTFMYRLLCCLAQSVFVSILSNGPLHCCRYSRAVPGALLPGHGCVNDTHPTISTSKFPKILPPQAHPTLAATLVCASVFGTQSLKPKAVCTISSAIVPGRAQYSWRRFSSGGLHPQCIWDSHCTQGHPYPDLLNVLGLEMSMPAPLLLPVRTGS